MRKPRICMRDGRWRAEVPWSIPLQLESPPVLRLRWWLMRQNEKLESHA